VVITRTRLRDVAALAGVSEKTVSNFVNGYPYMSDDTKAKVQAALTELNYQPNLSARNLSTGRTGFIALAVPVITNPHFSEVARYVIEAAVTERWTVLIEQPNWRTEHDALGVVQPLVDGIILHPESMTEAELAHRAANVPIVLIVERSFPGVVADKVHVDNVRAAYEITRHLIERGHTTIAGLAFGPNDPLPTGRLRYEGYARAMQEFGLPVDDRLALHLEKRDRADGAAAAAQVLELPFLPDAVLCFNDVLALGLIGGLHAAGLTVPDDIAVAGFDGIEEGAFSVPTLTTVAWDTKRIAEEAVSLLADRQKDPELPMREIVVQHRLLIRESTAG
jgi:LacI family transcriptional regulator, repressor for deo operon, udp, cdd, tsx, nupC, and nupG